MSEEPNRSANLTNGIQIYFCYMYKGVWWASSMRWFWLNASQQVDQVETMKNNKNKRRIHLLYLTKFGFTFMNYTSPLTSPALKRGSFLSTIFVTLLFYFFLFENKIGTFTNFLWLTISLWAHQVTLCCLEGSIL